MEMKAKKYVRNLSMSDETRDRVLFQGDLGDLKTVSIVDEKALEVLGNNGVLRVEVNEDILRRVLSIENRVLCLKPVEGQMNETKKRKE